MSKLYSYLWLVILWAVASAAVAYAAVMPILEDHTGITQTQATIARVQGAAGGGLSATATFGIAANNGVVGYLHYCSAAAGTCPGTDVTGTITITDDQGGSYTLGSAITDAAQGTTGRCFYGFNVHPATQPKTLTVSGLSNSSSEDAILFDEFFGGVTLDGALSGQSQTGVGTGSNAVTSGAAGGTTSTANDTIYAATVNAGGPGNFNIGTGFAAGATPNIYTKAEYDTTVSQGANITGTFTNAGASSDFITCALALKPGTQTVGPASIALNSSSVSTTSSATAGTVLTAVAANYPHMNNGSTFSGTLSASGTYNGSPLCAINGTNVTLGQSNPPPGSGSCTVTATQNGIQASTNLSVTITGTTISGVALSNGNNFTVPAAANSTLDTLTATCSSGSCAGATFALSTSGSCSGASSNGSFAIAGSNLNVGASTISSTGSYPIGIAVTLSGATNSGVCYPVTLTGQAQTIASITPSSCSMIVGTTGVCTALTVTMSPASPSFAADGGTLSLVASGGACSGIDSNWATDFSLSGGNLSVVNGSLATGTYNACVQASASGITTVYQQVAVAITPSDPTVGLLPAASDGYAGWSTAGITIPITASIATNGTMTVTVNPSYAMGPGQVISGVGVTSGTTITAMSPTGGLTGTGGTGTYTVSPAPSVAISSEAMTAVGIPNRTTIYTTLSPSGGDDTNAIKNAIAACPHGQVVLLTTGVFHISANGGGGVGFVPNTGDQMPNCTLRGSGVGNLLSTGLNKVDGGGTVRSCASGTLTTYGDGSFCTDPTATQLVKTDRASDTNNPVISAQPLGLLNENAGASGSYTLATDAIQGAYSITVTATPTAVHVGDIVGIDENTDNDPNVDWGPNADAPGGGERRWFGLGVYTCGALTCNRQDRSIEQLFEVSAVNGTTITFDTPINYPFHTSTTCSGCASQVVTWSGGFGQFVRGIGVENMFVWGGMGGEGNGDISFSNCAYCWMKNVEAVWSNGPNLGLHQTFKNVIRDSFVHETPTPVPGGGGYLLEVSAGSANNLIENNIFWYGNKVDVMKATGGGNVFAYNYTDDAFGDGYPDSPEAGVNAAHYTTPHLELLEGNYGQNFKGDDYWGNSIYITAFRNWFSTKRAGAPEPTGIAPLNTFKGGGCHYGDYIGTGTGGGGIGRVAVDVQSDSFYQAFIGNVLGLSGNPLYTEPAGGCGDPAESGWIDQITTTAQNNAANNNQVPVWVFGDRQGANWSFVDTTINTQTRTANWDWYLGSMVCYAYGSTSTVSCSGVTVPNSFYLTAKPPFFASADPWPWVDPTTGTTYTLPAKYCFEHQLMPTCRQGL